MFGLGVRINHFYMTDHSLVEQTRTIHSSGRRSLHFPGCRSHFESHRVAQLPFSQDEDAGWVLVELELIIGRVIVPGNVMSPSARVRGGSWGSV
jgi:hypothetical protein